MSAYVSLNQEGVSFGARARFGRAYRRAKRQLATARMTGHSADLLCFDLEQRRVGATTQSTPKRSDIPLTSIVGSVGRCGDFTRTFQPKHKHDEERWTRVLAATLGDRGTPPISVYALFGRYFVLDGHHRVSVARQLGHPYIEAYVTEVKPLTRVSSRSRRLEATHDPNVSPV